jgi:leucyl-tRNA synthetase
MSKSKGNAVAPHEYGAETTRLFVLSAAHPNQAFEWTAKSVDEAYGLQQLLYETVVEYVDRDAGDADGDVAVNFREESRPHDRYIERELDRTIAAVTDEFDRFRLHRAIAEIRELVRLVRRYREYGAPSRYTYGRALRTLSALVAPLAPFLAEELWHLLDERGLVVEADWPEPLKPAADYRIERDLVRSTLADVRSITDVVDVGSPEVIELGIAADWKYRAYDLAREADEGAALVGQILSDEAVPRTDAAASFAADLDERRPGLEPVLDGDRERELLEQAAWLFDDEFDAEIVVRLTDDEDDAELAERARPGRPAIRIS